MQHVTRHTPTHEVPEDVEAVEVGHLAASVDVSSRHRLAQLVGVGEDWEDIVWRANNIHVEYG